MANEITITQAELCISLDGHDQKQQQAITDD
jgi:hypothetical protein